LLRVIDSLGGRDSLDIYVDESWLDILFAADVSYLDKLLELLDR